jgi:hypothetical protein
VTIDRSKLSECGSKQRHADKPTALAHRAAMIRAGTAMWRIHVYRCRHCGAWHVGHKPEPKKNRR